MGFSLASSLEENSVKDLTEDNWDSVLKGEWMIEFYAPWCPACRALQSTWEEFSTWTEDLSLNGIAQVDVTTSPGLSGRFLVTALPTIIHVKDGEFRVYRGSRDKDAFISFIEDQKWKEIEIIPAWKDPRSIQMTAVSYFFRMSMILRSLHTQMTEVYGLPYWASYLAFAAVTVVIGALLGLILVCCIDFIYPPSTIEYKEGKSVTVTQKSKKKEDEDSEEKEKDSSVEEEVSGSPSASSVRRRKAKKVE